jgi:predicted ATP-dependent endonuclease of OLD family
MLRLKSITFSHFRGILRGAINDFADVNILIGRNNSGKSTVAEGIMRLAEGTSRRHFGTNPLDYLGRNATTLWAAVRNEQQSQPFPVELWYRQDQSQPIEMNAELDSSGNERTTKLSFGIKCLNINNWEEPYHVDMGSIVTPLQVGQFLKGIMAFRPSDAVNPQFEAATWDQVVAFRGDKILTRLLNEIFMVNAESLQIISNKLKVLFSDRASSLDVQGDGTRAALRCLMVLTLLRGTLFILEEPECHQHAGSLERFARGLCTLAKEREVQLSISTHSGECLRAFLAASKEVGSESAVFHLKLDDGLLDATRLGTDAVQTLQETGVDVRFLDLYG